MSDIISRLGQNNRTTKSLPVKERSAVIKFLQACEDESVAEQVRLSYPTGSKWLGKQAVRSVQARLGAIDLGKVDVPSALLAVVEKLRHEGFHAVSKEEMTEAIKKRFYTVLSLKQIEPTGKVVINIAHIVKLMVDGWFKTGDAEKVATYATVMFDAGRLYCLIDNITRVYKDELNRVTRISTWKNVIKDTLNVDFS